MDKTVYLRQIDDVIAQGPYAASWDSLSAYEAPMWYRDAKFGIFIHWGIYSVPAFKSEWYSRNMYIQGSPAYEHHIKTYGAHKDFGYKDFVPMFTAEKFDAEAWMSLIEQAGARYVVPVAEHHDGFQMYDSELSRWNAKEMGPRRDVIGELTQAAMRHGIQPCASSHRVEHWFFMGHGRDFDSDITDDEKLGDFYWPAMPEANHHDLHSEPAPTAEFMEDWLMRCCEIVDRYQPRIVYFDWWIQHAAVKPYLKKFAAYYYNRAQRWGIEVAINYKHEAFMFGCAVPDIERGQFADMKHYFWQTDTSVAKNSWCYTENNEYKQAKDILCDLVDIVSKNGALLLNIGPKPDGSIPQEDVSILLEIGQWLRCNGEGIYGTRCWRKSGEGPTQVEEGQFTDIKDKVFTSEDIRFTMKGDTLYAFVMSYPEDGKVTIRSLAQSDASRLPVFAGIVKEVSLLGWDEKPTWYRDEQGLHVRTTGVASEKPVTLRIVLD